MSSHPLDLVTPQAYLEFERAAATKHEFIEGAILAMAGGSPAHALLIANCLGELHRRLRGGPCDAFSSDLRVCVYWDRLITYPDVTVVCGDAEFVDEHKDTITNPTVIIEVLSPSTSNYDRGNKSYYYRRLRSLQEFLLVDQQPVEIQHDKRSADGSWSVSYYRSRDDTVQLPSIGCSLAVADIYRGVERYLS